MIKYFGGHTEVSWSKTMRATYDHQVRSCAPTPCAGTTASRLPDPSRLPVSAPQGLSESRCASHNSHFGMRELNKKDFSIFPFTFRSMGTTAQRHGVEYAPDAE